MYKYKVVIVDDEYWALQGVKNSFPWEEYNFEIIFTTTSSIEAYDQIRALEPDVVFTDVCMPEMTGIELCIKCREEGYPTLFVFVSGFDDYKYTREAIINGAFDYCLKPIDEQETDKILKRLRDHLERQYDDEDVFPADIPDDEDKSNTRDIYNREFKRMMDYINDNYTKPLLLKDLAKQFFINESYCCFLFNKHVGMSFSKYINKLRIEKAMRIIEQNRTLSIDEVADLTGYASYYHFNKKFKEVTGVSPAQFRKGMK